MTDVDLAAVAALLRMPEDDWVARVCGATGRLPSWEQTVHALDPDEGIRILAAYHAEDMDERCLGLLAQDPSGEVRDVLASTAAVLPKKVVKTLLAGAMACEKRHPLC